MQPKARLSHILTSFVKTEIMILRRDNETYTAKPRQSCNWLREKERRLSHAEKLFSTPKSGMDIQRRLS
jgi:hypothetical protein